MKRIIKTNEPKYSAERIVSALRKVSGSQPSLARWGVCETSGIPLYSIAIRPRSEEEREDCIAVMMSNAETLPETLKRIGIR